MIHGSIAGHTTFDPFVEVLRNDLTTFAMDRRGFGASGDKDVSAIERDFEDIATVVDTVAARTAGPVALRGHSYGASGAMGAAARTRNVHHLVLYEPSAGSSMHAPIERAPPIRTGRHGSARSAARRRSRNARSRSPGASSAARS
jgi:pimeloyl-ACP methyl ester carboxylesterase